MPNCFILIRKDDLKGGPVAFSKIDAELCQRLDLPFDDHQYTCGWYDAIGLALAMGMTLPELVDHYRKEAEEDDPYPSAVIAWRIAAHLCEYYTSNAWAEIGRR
jgi:hypothetical protein